MINVGKTKIRLVTVSIFNHRMKQKSIKIEKITTEDLGFLNETRNMVSKEYLHDSRTFTLKETQEWFSNNTPDYYIIKHNDVRVGYFRLSNHSSENQNIYIGADIHPNFWGQGIASAAYEMFINYLFDTYHLHKISLEVLASNTRAISLYRKLGFVEEGKKRDEVFKDGVYVDSIIMSILRNEWV